MKLSVVVCVLVAFQAVFQAVPSEARLNVDYYKESCRNVEHIVNDIVTEALKVDRGKGAGLVRLLFHDCFVRGCDASVLLDPSGTNPFPEKMAGANIGLRGFDVIDAIKNVVETYCPGVVSCADILAYAARDAAKYLSDGGIDFVVPAGRLDGVVSFAGDSYKFLPDSTFDIKQLIKAFADKNLTVDELVILSGAHSIGVAHCSSFKTRLAALPDQMTPAYRALLGGECDGASPPNPAVVSNIRDQNPASVAKSMPYYMNKLRWVKHFLDNSYYHNSLDNLVLFNSDWELLTTKDSLDSVNEYANNGTKWSEDFADALVKLSKLSMPCGSKGEIRKKCSAIT